MLDRLCSDMYILDAESYVPGSFAARTRAKVVAAALTNNFDKSVTQIVDWLEMEREMLKKHCVVVADSDMILDAIDKQKVCIVQCSKHSF